MYIPIEQYRSVFYFATFHCILQKLEKLRQQLQSNFRWEPSSGIHLAMRTPKGTKLNNTFSCSATTKVNTLLCVPLANPIELMTVYFFTLQDLYEFVYAYGEVEQSFTVYHATPRSQIACSPVVLPLEEYGIGKSLLVIEENEDGVDPITWCSNEPQQVPQSQQTLIVMFT